jgi:predicted PurR-regulated permease PerM
LPETPTLTIVRSSAALKMLTALVGLWVLQWAQAFLVPVLIAVFVTYTLTPLVSWLERKHLPRSVGAALVVITLLGALGVTTLSLRTETARILDELPRAVHALSLAVTSFRDVNGGAVGKVQAAARELARATGGTAALGAGNRTTAVRVVVDQDKFQFGSLFWAGSFGAMSALAQFSIVIFLVFFLLQGGDTFRRRLVKVAGSTLSEKKITVKILDDISLSLQRYMFMLLVTNALLAVCSWIAFRLIGLDNAGAWGVATGALHIVPYFGSILTALASGAAAFLQFGTLSSALLVAGVSMGLATLIGVFVTTWMTGRLAKMNPTAVFIALLFFGWIWGPWGLLLAIPLVVAFKVTAEHIEALHPAAELLAG